MSLATLSRAGYISSPKLIAKKMFDYYILSLYSQSTIFYGSIASLAYSLEVGSDVESFILYSEELLATYYKSYFDTVEIKLVNESTDVKGNVGVYMKLTKDGVTFSLDEVIDISEGVINLSNYGE
jgi:hypothetical protein